MLCISEAPKNGLGESVELERLIAHSPGGRSSVMLRDVGYFEKVQAVRGPQINSQQGGSTSRHALSDVGHVLSSVLVATMPARCCAGANRGQTTLLVSHVEWPASGGERQVGAIFAILFRMSRHLGWRSWPCGQPNSATVGISVQSIR